MSRTYCTCTRATEYSSRTLPRLRNTTKTGGWSFPGAQRDVEHQVKRLVAIQKCGQTRHIAPGISFGPLRVTACITLSRESRQSVASEELFLTPHEGHGAWRNISWNMSVHLLFSFGISLLHQNRSMIELAASCRQQGWWLAGWLPEGGMNSDGSRQNPMVGQTIKDAENLDGHA